MKNSAVLFTLWLAASLLSGCATAKPDFTNWPAGSDPRTIGLRVSENYLERSFRTNSKAGFIVYPEACAAFGALRFAEAIGDARLEQKLIARFAPVWRPENKKLIPAGGHVDLSVFDTVPLEIFLLECRHQFARARADDGRCAMGETAHERAYPRDALVGG